MSHKAFLQGNNKKKKKPAFPTWTSFTITKEIWKKSLSYLGQKKKS